jgi:hypothetical protein
MAYVGNPIDTQNTFQSLVGKRFNGDGSTTDFTLDVAPGNVLDIEVFVGNVRQDPNSAYTVSGTTLSFTGAPPSGTNNIYVVHQAKSVGTIDVPAGGVAADSLATSVLTGQTDIGAAIADADLFLVDDGAGGTLRKTAASRIKTYAGFSVSDITGATELAETPADTDEFIISDAGTLKRLDFSHIKSVAGTVAFQATGTSSQTGLSDNTSTKRNFVSEIFDTASAYDTSTSRFTVPSGQGGKYLISANVNMEAASAGKVINSELQIRVDGTSVRNTLFKTDFNEFDRFDMNATTILNLSAGEYVEIYGNINTDNGSDWNMYSGATTNVFTGFRIA